MVACCFACSRMTRYWSVVAGLARVQHVDHVLDAAGLSRSPICSRTSPRCSPARSPAVPFAISAAATSPLADIFHRTPSSSSVQDARCIMFSAARHSSATTTTLVVIDGRVRTHELRWLGRFIRVQAVSTTASKPHTRDMRAVLTLKALYFQLFIS